MKKLALLLTALALMLADALPASAQQGVPILGIERSGSPRNLKVKNPFTQGLTPDVNIGAVEEATGLFLPANALLLRGGTLTGSITVAGVTGLTDADIPNTITATNYVLQLGLGNNNFRWGDPTTTLASIVPNEPDANDGTSLIAIGGGAMRYSVSPNSTIAIGVNAAANYGQQRDIVTNDATFTGWGLGTGWSAAGGFATHAPGTASSITKPTIEIVDAVPYYVMYTITDRTAGTLQPKFSGGGTIRSGIVRSTNGVFIEPQRGAEGNTQVEFAASSDFDGKVSAIRIQTLGGRASVFIGHVAGQYAGNGPSNTFIGAYAGQGQEYDPVTGLLIAGTVNGHPLSGGNSTCVGEASCLHVIGGAGGITAMGFNAAFSMTTGGSLVALGVNAAIEATTLTKTVAVGTNSYKRGNGDSNTFIGDQAAVGSIVSSTLVGTVAVGGTSLTLTDATGFATGMWISSGTFIPPGATITNVAGNVITFDKAAFQAVNGASVNILVTGFVVHTGELNVSLGALSLAAITGDADFNVALGAQACQSMQDADNNICIGRASGSTITTGQTNIMIGLSAQPSSATASNELNLGNTIFGTGMTTVNGKIGIGSLPETYAFEVDGEIHIKGTSSSLRMDRRTSGLSAPGDGIAQLRMQCGTNAGTMKLVVLAGASATAVTIADNIGSGNTGC